MTIARIGVAGAGTMGSGIALVSARAGFETVLFDVSEEATQRALTEISSFLGKSVEKGRMTDEERSRALERVTLTTDLDGMSGCGLVIEAVFEDPAVKGELLSRLDGVCAPDAIFASNTSTLSITELASASQRPDRFVGMHFCLPAQLMALVEMTPGLTTSEEAFESAWGVCVSMGQKPVRTADRPGFILNRFLVPFNNDVVRLVEQGVAEPAHLDRAVEVGLGYPMGPCRLLDYIGLDTQVLLSEALYAKTREPRASCPPLARRMVAAGHLGRKTGRGFYDYGVAGAMFGA